MREDIEVETDKLREQVGRGARGLHERSAPVGARRAA